MTATLTDDLAGRVAVVTGAASGIGAAVAAELAAHGAHVAALDLRPAEDGVLSLEVDVGSAGAVHDAFERVYRDLGPPTLAVHSAGVVRDAVLWKLDDDAWREVLRVNLDGAFHLLRELTPHLRSEGGGSAVLVGSINGLRGKFGQSAYAASKAGLAGLAKTAARELGRFGGRVNVVAPGLVETPMTAALPNEWREMAIGESVLGRAATPADVAAPVVFLLSGRARHITGQVLTVDGGQYM